MALEVEKYLNWEPSFKNEIWISDKRKQHRFTITLKKGEDIEVEFNWDYGNAGSGNERTYIPAQLLKDLISELEAS